MRKSLSSRLPQRATRVAVRIALLALLAAAAVPVAVSASTFPGVNGRIAFTQSTGTGQTNSIFTANPDGSGVVQVTSGHSDDYPRLSADGNWIVFTRYGFPSTAPGGSAGHVMIVRVDGTGLRDLSGTALQTTPNSDLTPSFSPDGTQVVFSRLDNSTDQFTGIYEEPVAGGATSRITSGPDTEPTFSPDGTKIAFVREADTSTGAYSAIYTVPPVILAGATQVTNPPAHTNDLNPDWSPNGKQLVFDRSAQITVQSSDGSGTATTLTTGHVDRRPAYSPDGTRIIFARLTQGVVGPGGSQPEGLFEMNANGSNVSQVPGLGASSSASNASPDWGSAPQTNGGGGTSGGGNQPPPSGGCGSTNEPDRNGDLHSHCHTGAKGRGAGGNDKQSTHRHH